MAVNYVARTGKTYYLHVKTTGAGRTTYYFSTKASGPLVPAIPDGYEVYENVGGQVFLRRKTAPIIRPEELELVSAALLKHGEPWHYRAEVKKNMIVIHEASKMENLDTLAREFQGIGLFSREKLRHTSYMAVMRFILTDEEDRSYATERFCFRGSVDDWIIIGGPGRLSDQLRQFVKHLGRESLYDLY